MLFPLVYLGVYAFQFRLIGCVLYFFVSSVCVIFPLFYLGVCAFYFRLLGCVFYFVSLGGVLFPLIIGVCTLSTLDYQDICFTLDNIGMSVLDYRGVYAFHIRLYQDVCFTLDNIWVSPLCFTEHYNWLQHCPLHDFVKLDFTGS